MSLSFPLRDRILYTSAPAFIMGIVNATPDSFYPGSRAGSVEDAVERALQMEAEGADIVDIGGESSRPGGAYVSAEEELSRVLPVIEGIRSRSAVPISVDTRKAAVMKAALDAGADMCNDISALEDDHALADLLAAAGAPVVLMHKKGTPDTMQLDPRYADPAAEVLSYLLERAEYAQTRGIRKDMIILDPGIGFGKRKQDNLALIAATRRFTAAGYPVLMALSRKTCIGDMTGKPVSHRLAGTLAANQIAVGLGAQWLRVHDVGETRDMLAVVQELQTYGIH
ncbi:dihydropteroate synthase [Treponema zuelzerae]|uniref:dihydropteroate synthase n=1 Tax=Teretinema zuelzerae TaxID=156 RepID=A0AAE3EHS5_9SPIR|nr:dihydropteroate synthase [Teretinema zuelzerae]MCD1654902.1 dihydropteroate synthase [Teretinema zuelzerae]